MALTIHEFWQLVVASGLHDEETCRRLSDRFANARDAGEIADTVSLPEWMLAAGALTRYQAKVLLAGNSGPFAYGDYLVTDVLDLPGVTGLFRGVHRATGIKVALLFLSGSAITDAVVVDALAGQAAAAAKVSRGVPYLTHCHALVDEGAYKFFVLDELPAGTLADRLNRGPAISVKDAARVMVEVTTGLAALHAVGQVHGAVRPDRIWLPRSGPARLASFPLARDPLTVVGLHAPTEVEPAAVDYCPPECAEGAAPRMAGDMYSLGCTLYQLLGGRVPFEGETPDERLAAHRHATPVPLEQLNPAVPKGLATMVARLMSRQPDARYADAKELAAALEPVARKLGESADPKVALATRGRLDAWLAEHGGLPNADKAAVPLAIAPADDSASVATRRGQKPGRRQSRVAVLVGGMAAILIAAAVGGYLASSGWMVASPAPAPQPAIATSPPAQGPPADTAAVPTVTTPSDTPDEKAAIAVEQPVADSSASDQQPPVAPATPPARTSTSNEGLVGLDAPLWASPTHGPPLDLKYMAPGAEVIVAVRPADLCRHPEAEKLLDPRTSGALGRFVTEELPQLVAAPITDIESVTLGIVNDTNGQPQLILVARLSAAAERESLLKAWGDPQQSEREGVPYYQAGDRAYYVPELDAGRTIVVGPPGVITEDIIPAAGAAPPLGQDMEDLLAASDDQRHVTVLATPGLLETAGRDWLPGKSERFRAPLTGFLVLAPEDLAQAREPKDAAAPSGNGLPKALLASAHLTDADLFLELRVPGPPGRPAIVAARAYQQHVAQLSKQVRDFIRSVELSEFSRDVLVDFPLMVDQLTRHTVVGTAGRQVVLRTYLPSAAAHNLALATNLALDQQPRAGHEAPARMAAGQKAAPAEPLARRLERKISLSFDRATLEKALELVADEIEARVVILGSDLQTEGITKNQSFGLEERDQPAREILQKIMLRANPDGKLVYVVRPTPEAGGETLVITTRASARQRGEALPEELTERP